MFFFCNIEGKKILGFICVNFFIYICNKREKFEVVIRDKYCYVMNGNVDIFFN